ncbi:MULTISPECIES: hypothetical protein [unclassified Streptomyces]|uniref:hypothetical protein n=1 Tax=unclassified Streptomyces TaxID=2593676 RepID=UPI002E36AA28|nr:hypothetical protein [Streptomyces sp. NBC_01268]
MTASPGTGFSDGRSFSLIGYRHSHAQVILRGFPPFDDLVVENGEGTVLDVCFNGVQRVACGRDIGPLHLRIASADERSALEERIGPLRWGEVFLLEPDSVESYVVAGKARWAEFLVPVPFTLPSPLDADNKEEAAAYPPVGGTVHLLPAS